MSIPNATVLITSFIHCVAYAKKPHAIKWGSHQDREVCLELPQKMAYAALESEYDKIYSYFQNDAPREVDYFNTIGM